MLKIGFIKHDYLIIVVCICKNSKILKVAYTLKRMALLKQLVEMLLYIVSKWLFKPAPGRLSKDGWLDLGSTIDTSKYNNNIYLFNTSAQMGLLKYENDHDSWQKPRRIQWILDLENKYIRMKPVLHKYFSFKFSFFFW